MRWFPIGLTVVLAIACSLAARGQDMDGDAATQPTAAPRIDDKAMGRLGWELACVAGSFRDRSTYEMAVLLHALNLHHIELSPGQALRPDAPEVTIRPDMTDADIDTLLAKLKSLDLDVVSYGVVTPGSDPGRARQIFQFARKLKVQNIVVDAPASSLAMLDALANEYRINVAIVNRAKPGNNWNVDTLMNALRGRSRRMGVCADVANWRQSGWVPVQCIRKLGDRIMEVHLRDLNDQDQEVPVGGGVCGISDVLGTLKQEKFKGVCGIECFTSSGAVLVNTFILSIDGFTDAVEALSDRVRLEFRSDPLSSSPGPPGEDRGGGCLVLSVGIRKQRRRPATMRNTNGIGSG